MKNIFMSAVGALAIGSTAFAAVPAEARHGNRGGYSDHRGSHGVFRGGRGYGSNRAYRSNRSHRFNRGYRNHGGYYGYRGSYPSRYRYGYDNDDAGIAIGAGVLGLVLGTAIASGRNDRYDDYYDDGGDYYYDDPYGY